MKRECIWQPKGLPLHRFNPALEVRRKRMGARTACKKPGGWASGLKVELGMEFYEYKLSSIKLVAINTKKAHSRRNFRLKRHMDQGKKEIIGSNQIEIHKKEGLFKKYRKFFTHS